MMSLMFAVLLMAGEPAAAPAATDAPAPPPAAAAATTPAKGAKPPPGPNDLVCKREAVVGTRLTSRICLTQQDWDQRRTDSRDELKKAQRGQPYEAH